MTTFPGYILNTDVRPLDGIRPGQQVSISVCFAIPWSGDPTVAVNWGDSTPAQSVALPAYGTAATLSHTYASHGTFPVTVVGPAGPTVGLNPFQYTVTL